MRKLTLSGLILAALLALPTAALAQPREQASHVPAACGRVYARAMPIQPDRCPRAPLPQGLSRGGSKRASSAARRTGCWGWNAADAGSGRKQSDTMSEWWTNRAKGPARP
jgi:hypothetical protein